MPGDRAVCRARTAVRPFAVLSRLAGPGPLRSAAFSAPARCRRQHDDPRARHVDTSSLAVTLEAHRRANRTLLIQRVPSTDDAQRNGGRRPGPKRQMVGAKHRVLPPAGYVGQAVEPIYISRSIEDEQLPWFTASRRPNATPMDRLRAEMEAFEQYIRPTPDERAGRAAVIDQTRDTWLHLSSAARGTWRRFGLELFGSERTGLATTTSDLDLRVCHPYAESTMQAPTHSMRCTLAKALMRALAYYQADTNFAFVFFRHSRYPLISMQHSATSLEIQIVCSNDTSRARAIMEKYMQELPALRTVYTIFRYLLEARGLTDVYQGGMGSYSLFYMVVAGMKLASPTNQDHAGAQLLAVMDFYSHLDTVNAWISLDPLEILRKIEKKAVQSKREKTVLPLVASEVLHADCPKALKAHDKIGLQLDGQPFLLCIRDPADRTNDVGRKTFTWKHIQATFRALRKEMLQGLERDDGSLLLTPVVGRNFEAIEARRQKLAEFGRKHSARRLRRLNVDTAEEDQDQDVRDIVAAQSAIQPA